MKLKNLILIPLLASTSLVLELALSFLPNIQLTFLLFILYSKKFKFKEVVLIIFLHVIFDNLIMGSFNIIVMLPMMLGYLLIPLVLKLTRIDGSIKLAFLSIIFSVMYAWMFIPFNSFFLDAKMKHMFLLDIPFTAVLAISSFLSVIWLYEPLSKFFDLKVKNEDEL